MTQVSSDEEFRKVLDDMDVVRQRVLAARFVQNVLPLSNDKRLAHVVEVAADENATVEELDSVYRSALAAAIEGHTRCGSEGDWTEQAGYFVARAAAASVSQAGQADNGPAWQAAMSARMARTCKMIDATDDGAHSEEREAQYRMLNEYLSS